MTSLSSVKQISCVCAEFDVDCAKFAYVHTAAMKAPPVNGSAEQAGQQAERKDVQRAHTNQPQTCQYSRAPAVSMDVTMAAAAKATSAASEAMSAAATAVQATVRTQHANTVKKLNTKMSANTSPVQVSAERPKPPARRELRRVAQPRRRLLL